MGVKPGRRPGRRYGRRYKHDARDANYRLHAIHSLRNERHWNSDVLLDQEATQSCVGQAWAGLLLSPPLSGQFVDPLGIYEMAGRYDAGDSFNPEDGTSVRAGAKVLQALGFIKSYHWAHELEPLVYTLLELGPVVVGTNWYEDMDQVDNRGFAHIGGECLGGHAYLLDAVEVPRQRLRIKNSWGLDYGREGRAWISFADVAELLHEEGEACLAIEQKPKALLAARQTT